MPNELDKDALDDAWRAYCDPADNPNSAIERAIRAYLTSVAEAEPETIKARAAAILCEAGALCGWPAPNCNAREGAEALFNAGLLAHPAPSGMGVKELLEEGLEILNSLIDNVKRHGNYSPESTCMFIDQAGQCIRKALTTLSDDSEENAHD